MASSVGTTPNGMSPIALPMTPPPQSISPFPHAPSPIPFLSRAPLRSPPPPSPAPPARLEQMDDNEVRRQEEKQRVYYAGGGNGGILIEEEDDAELQPPPAFKHQSTSSSLFTDEMKTSVPIMFGGEYQESRYRKQFASFPTSISGMTTLGSPTPSNSKAIIEEGLPRHAKLVDVDEPEPLRLSEPPPISEPEIEPEPAPEALVDVEDDGDDEEGDTGHTLKLPRGRTGNSWNPKSSDSWIVDSYCELFSAMILPLLTFLSPRSR